MDIEKKIFDFMTKRQMDGKEWVSPQEIAGEIGEEKGKVNAFLYKNRKRFEKTSEANGTKPMWRLIGKRFTDEESILELLNDEWIPLADIVRKTGLKKTDVNSILYGYQKKGITEKTSEANGTKPMWRLIQKND